MNMSFVWKGCSRVRVWSRRPCNKFFGSTMLLSSAWMHLAQCDPGLDAGKQISRTVGFCMTSPQRAGVEKLTLAVCLLPELSFAAVMSGGGTAGAKTQLPHASHCTCSSLSCLVPRAAAGARHTPGKSSWFPTVFCEQSVPLASEVRHLSTPAQILPSWFSKTFVGFSKRKKAGLGQDTNCVVT